MKGERQTLMFSSLMRGGVKEITAMKKKEAGGGGGVQERGKKDRMLWLKKKREKKIGKGKKLGTFLTGVGLN